MPMTKKSSRTKLSPALSRFRSKQNTYNSYCDNEVLDRLELITASRVAEFNLTWEFVTSQRGKRKLVSEGFLYNLEKYSLASEVHYWRCERKSGSTRCPARKKLLPDGQLVGAIQHNHDPDFERAEMLRVYGGMKKIAELSEDAPNEIIETSTSGISDDIVAKMPTLTSMRRAIQRRRRKVLEEGLESSQDALPMLSHPVLPGSSQHEDIPRDIPLPTLKKIRTSTSNACESRPPLREVDHSNTPPPPILTQQTNLPPQMLCVRWGNYDSNMHSMFTKLLTKEHFVDVTLACEGRTIRCHKVVLSSCSTYFEQLLTENPCPHPIIFMKDLQFWEVQALVDFMYKGEVNVPQEKLPSLLKSAECLQVKGLGASGTDGNNDKPLETPTTSNEQPQIQNIQRSVSSPIATKRRRQEATNHETYRSTPTNSSTNRRSDGHKHQRITPQSSLPHGVTAFPHSKMSHVDIQSQMMIKMEPEEIDLQEDSVDSNHFKDEESIDKDPDRTNNDIEGNITSETTTEHRAQRRMNAEQHGEEPNRTQEHLNFGPELSMADLGKETQDDEDSDNDIESDQDIDTSSREPPDINRLKQDSEPH